MEEPERVARDCLSALSRRDLEAARTHLADHLRAKVARRVGATGLEPVADGVWRVRGGIPVRARNVYLLADDGGVTAFEIADTVGADVAGSTVVDIPGHAPGMIALVRDGLALTGDGFYVVDEATGRPRPPHLPHSAFNRDDAQARESLLRLAGLDLTVAWPRHGAPLRGDVRRELERAAA
jgi:glyoxylase-like metal-dependent hydrolase (beta-lactamase superfamily II)